MYEVGQILAASELSGGPFSYTPELSTSGSANPDPDLGSGPTQEGWWMRTLQRLVIFEARIRFGTGSASGTGLYEVTLPTPADSAFHNDTGAIAAFSTIGNGAIRDDSAPVGASAFKIIVGLADASDPAVNDVAKVRLFHMDGSNTTVQSDAPFTWSDGDRITIRGTYIMPLS